MSKEEILERLNEILKGSDPYPPPILLKPVRDLRDELERELIFFPEVS